MFAKILSFIKKRFTEYKKMILGDIAELKTILKNNVIIPENALKFKIKEENKGLFYILYVDSNELTKSFYTYHIYNLLKQVNVPNNTLMRANLSVSGFSYESSKIENTYAIPNTYTLYTDNSLLTTEITQMYKSLKDVMERYRTQSISSVSIYIRFYKMEDFIK